MASRGDTTRERLVVAAEALLLRHGYAGMSLDELLRETGLSKGAFFHHFPGKAALARAVLAHYADTDLALFESWAERADRLSDDPLERVLIFLRLFEEHLDQQESPPPGCVFASFTYQRAELDAELHAMVRQRLARWQGLFAERLEALIAVRPPALRVDAEALAELIVAVIEGGLITANITGDGKLLQRLSGQLRTYLTALFQPPR